MIGIYSKTRQCILKESRTHDLSRFSQLTFKGQISLQEQIIIKIVDYLDRIIGFIKINIKCNMSKHYTIFDIDSAIISLYKPITPKLTYNHEKNLLINGAGHYFRPLFYHDGSNRCCR